MVYNDISEHKSTKTVQKRGAVISLKISTIADNLLSTRETNILQK